MQRLDRPNPFLFRDYKKLLGAWIDYDQSKSPGAKARLADAIRIPRPYLSQVLHRKIHFTPDQALLTAQHYRLSDAETDYFLDLTSLSRASTREMRTRLEKKILGAQEKQAHLSERLQAPEINEDSQKWIFYSHWRLSPTCLLLLIPEFRTPEKIAERLGVSVQETENDLKTLTDLGLIEKKGTTWQATGKFLHLDKRSSISPMNHVLWRQRASLSLMNPKPENYHYTGVHTISKRDLATLREMIVDFLASTNQFLKTSEDEELVGLQLDLYRV